MNVDTSFSMEAFRSKFPQLSKRLVYCAEIGSTSDLAKKFVQSEGGQSGLLVVADYQTIGRGRRGNQWDASPCSALLFTLVLEPEVSRDHWSKFGLISGLAVVNVLRDLGFPAQLKWPNDVWLSGKKCCGILAEVLGEHLLIGVGLNVASAPKEGCSLDDPTFDINIPSRELLLGYIVQELIRLSSMVNHSSLIVQCNTAHALHGRMVSLVQGAQRMEGEVVAILENGALQLNTKSGVIEVIQAHEVRLLE